MSRNIFLLLQLLFHATTVTGNAPYFDGEFATLSVLFLPKDTKIGTVIYRFQASDSDGHYPLDFRVESQMGSDIARMENVDKLSANLILTKALLEGRIYNMTIAVIDTSRQETKLFIRVNATNARSTPDKVFVTYNSTITIPEDTKVNSTIGYVLARKHLRFQRFVTLELQGSSKFQIRSVLEEGNEMTRGNIILSEPLDYEDEHFFEITIIAQNVYEDVPLDNRNIMYLPTYIQVTDVQDSPPIFTEIPSLVHISTSRNTGEQIFSVKAIDGDKKNQRGIRYSIETGLSSQFLLIDEIAGNVMLSQSARIFCRESNGAPVVATIKAEEITNERSGSSTTKEVVIIFDIEKKAPPTFAQETYEGFIQEHLPAFSTLQLEGNTLISYPEQGPLDVFTLSLQDGEQNVDVNHIFEVLPPVILGEGQFQIRVKSPALLDYEKIKEINFKIIAKDVFGENHQSSSAIVKVQIQDINDNSPKFSKAIYDATISEDAPIGTLVTQVTATDKDSGVNGEIKYSNLIGNMSEKFSLDAKTGRITVAAKDGTFDREDISEITLTVEASDGGQTPKTNTTTLRINLLDVNDNAPTFKQTMYETVLTPDFPHQGPFLKLEAEDADEKGTNNSDVRYEIYSGNVNTAFQINPKTGEMTLNKDFQELAQSSAFNNDNTVYYLQVRAYDLGVPHKSTDVPVKVYIKTDPGYMNATVQYIIPGTQEEVNANRKNIEAMLMRFTGSRTTIQSVASYDETYGIPRDTKTESRSLVTTVVQHPKHSRVDIATVLHELNTSAVMINERSQELEYGQASVGWKIALIILLVLLAIILLILLGLCLRKYCTDKETAQKVRIEEDQFAPDKSKLIEVATVDKLLKEEKDNERRQAWDIEKQKAQTSRVVQEPTTVLAPEDRHRVNFIEPRRPSSAGPPSRPENGVPPHPGMMYSRHLRRTEPSRSIDDAGHRVAPGNGVYHTQTDTRRVNSSLGIESFPGSRFNDDQIEEIIIYEPSDRYNGIPRRTIKRVIKRRLDDTIANNPSTSYNNFTPHYTQPHTGEDPELTHGRHVELKDRYDLRDYEVYSSGSVDTGRRYLGRDTIIPDSYHARNDHYGDGRSGEADMWATRSRHRRVERGPSNQTKLSNIGSEDEEDGGEGSELYTSPDPSSVVSQRTPKAMDPGRHAARSTYTDQTDTESDVPQDTMFNDTDSQSLIKRRPHRGRQRTKRDAQIQSNAPVQTKDLLIPPQGDEETTGQKINMINVEPSLQHKDASVDATMAPTDDQAASSNVPTRHPASSLRSKSRVSGTSRKQGKPKSESRYMNWYKTSGKTPTLAKPSVATRSENLSPQPSPAPPDPTPQPQVVGAKSPKQNDTIPDESKHLKRQNTDPSLVVSTADDPNKKSSVPAPQEDDDDSGIGHGDSFKSSRKQFLEKRSLFTIAYNGMSNRQDVLEDEENS